MTTPRTELDTRFSGPAAQPISWEDTLEAIKQAEIFWISTVRTDGRPHVTPLVAIWLDDALHFTTGPDEQKARNLADNQRVALTTGANGTDAACDPTAVSPGSGLILHHARRPPAVSILAQKGSPSTPTMRPLDLMSRVTARQE